MTRRTRREFLGRCGGALAVAGLLGLAGCGENGEPTATDTGTPTPTPGQTPTVVDGPSPTPTTPAEDPTVTESPTPTPVPGVVGQPARRPAAADGAFFVVTTAGEATAIDAGDGSVRWRADSQVGTDVAPVVRGDTVVFAERTGVVGLSTETGQQRWRQNYFDSVVVGLTAGRGVAVASHSGVSWLSPADGALRWRTPVGGNDPTGPAVGAETVAVGLSSGGALALSSEDGAQRWRSRVGDERVFPPAVADGRVYAATAGRLRALGIDGGSREWTVEPDFAVATRPVASDGAVYLGTVADFDTGRAGTLTPPPTDVKRLTVNLVKLSADDGTAEWKRTEVWSNNFTDPGPYERPRGPSLAATPDRVYLVGGTELVAYDAASGDRLWRRDGLLGRAPAVTDGVASDGSVGVAVTDGTVVWPADTS